MVSVSMRLIAGDADGAVGDFIQLLLRNKPTRCQDIRVPAFGRLAQKGDVGRLAPNATRRQKATIGLQDRRALTRRSSASKPRPTPVFQAPLVDWDALRYSRPFLEAEVSHG